jgi:NADPH2:quinone reductase
LPRYFQGGELLAETCALVEPAGLVQSIGPASLKPTSIDFELARLCGSGGIEVFNVFSHGGAFGGDLAILFEWVARGELDPQVGWRGSWTQIAEAVDAFRGRQVRGKAVLDVHNAIESRHAHTFGESHVVHSGTIVNYG